MANNVLIQTLQDLEYNPDQVIELLRVEEPQQIFISVWKMANHFIEEKKPKLNLDTIRLYKQLLSYRNVNKSQIPSNELDDMEIVFSNTFENIIEKLSEQISKK